MLRMLSVLLGFFILCGSLQAEPVQSLRDGWAFSFREHETAPAVEFDSVSVPMNWTFYNKQLGHQREVTSLGIGRYERIVDLGEVQAKSSPESPAPLMLRIGEIGTACAVYIDDRLVAQRGIFGTRPDTHVPMVAPLYIVLPEAMSPRIKLTIEVSNFEDTNGGGIWGQVLLGRADQILGLRDWNVIRDSSIAGIFILVFLFYLVLFMYRRTDRALLLFSLICLAFFFRQITTSEKIAMLVVPSISWNILVRLEYLSLYVVAPLYILFFSVLFGPYPWPRWLTWCGVGLGILASLGVLGLSIPCFIKTLIIIQFYWVLLFVLTFFVLFRALRSKQEDSGLFLFSFSILVLGSLNDILLTRLYIPTLSLVTLAQVVFILIQSLALARRFAREFRRRENLEELNMHLKELDETRSRFLAAASHELRTPVSLIITPIDAILKGSYGETIAHDAQVFSLIRRNCERLKHLAESLLQVLKIDAGMMQPALQQVDLEDFVQNYVALFSAEASKKHIRLESRYPACRDHKLFVNTDPVMLETVVLNLLSNAIKFTPPEGYILIQLEDPETAYIVLSIQDSGPGIPLEQQHKLFTRYAASQGNRDSRIQSFGLGLPLSAEIIKLLGGTITVQSEIGHGSCFKVHIPCWQDTQRHEHKADEKRSSCEPHCKSPKAQSILIVEDDEDMRTFLQENLSRALTVHTARSGQEGLNKIHAGLVPDLIISDVMMHPMDGLAFREQLRSIPGFDAIPFLFISANPEPEVRSRALGTGAVDFIQKPFYIDDLTSKLFALMALRDCQQKGLEERVLRALRTHDVPSSKTQTSLEDRLSYINLTERDREVLELLLQGLSDKEIAVKLNASVRTISNRVSSLLKRTGQPSRSALIAFLGGRER
ncbi:ATP-binding protein [Gracilinema caldarium]|uniref:histidine kinase n=1 Tax=Gracilinema caldarium (strain ATCC 51460 / DSM 7334 / H1) TaxID=744872 RepID=F8EYV1_GRAC1|nr:ATP-binding protein [Gracilinema caldarium]AEJ18897.1 two component transcriptional regulator, LuxR family [Gracilinema caldarium DSM 7334]